LHCRHCPLAQTPPGHSASDWHPRQECDPGSQTSPKKPQSALFVHCTQVLVAVLQAGACGELQWASWVQATQRCPAQAGASCEEQSESTRQATQAPVAASQAGSDEGQSAEVWQ
jgi:hypothetical protein